MLQAIALRKDDREITVLEQSSLNREIGATISLQPNASKIVEKQWNLEALLAAKGSMVDRGFQVYNLDGKLQMRLPLNTTAKYGSERIIYHRVDLHDGLKSRCRDPVYPGRPVNIRVSNKVVSCDTEQGVVVLESGERLVADLIVAADGIKSVVRESILGAKVEPMPTGHSAYRIVIPMDEISNNQTFTDVLNPREAFTTMVLGHDKRLIMGPARNASMYSIVAMVPDETMHESSIDSSWNTKADLSKMLSTFKDFPAWAKVPLQLATEAGLWQLRDIDPLRTWYKGRAILIGDAAHAMLPTQGQGASQTVEDAEALGAFFADTYGSQTVKDIEAINELVFECRYKRATLIQTFSRQAARPATDLGDHTIKMNPNEFMHYNFHYNGALDWVKRQELANAVDQGKRDILGQNHISVEEVSKGIHRPIHVAETSHNVLTEAVS
jgi:salicylate hydroxylase